MERLMVAKNRILAIVAGAWAASCWLLPAMAAAPAGPAAARRAHPAAAPAAQQAAPKGDLDLWEQKLFGHQFDQDPLDKRIQRLELLLFSGTQAGSFSERL